MINKWTSIDEALPPRGEAVVVWVRHLEENELQSAEWNGTEWLLVVEHYRGILGLVYPDGPVMYVSHWMSPVDPWKPIERQQA